MTEEMFKVEEACQIAKIGRTKMFEEINAGRIKTVRVGRLVRIRAQDLSDWIQNLPSARPLGGQ